MEIKEIKKLQEKRKIRVVTEYLQSHLGTEKSLDDIIDEMTASEIAVLMFDFISRKRGEMISVEEELPTTLKTEDGYASLVFWVYSISLGIIRAVRIKKDSVENWFDLELNPIKDVTHWINLVPTKPLHRDMNGLPILVGSKINVKDLKYGSMNIVGTVFLDNGKLVMRNGDFEIYLYEIKTEECCEVLDY